MTKELHFGYLGESKRSPKKFAQLLYNLCFSQNIISMSKSRRLRWAVHKARKGERKNIYKVLVGMKEKRQFRRPGSRLEDNIKVDFKESG
jgi:hypothetical protein